MAAAQSTLCSVRPTCCAGASPTRRSAAIWPETPRRRGQYSILLTAEFTALRLSLLQHGEAGIDETLAQLHGTLKSQRQFLLLRTLDLCQAWLDAMRGRADPGAWYLTPEADASFLSPVLPMLRIVQNEVLLALGEWTKLLARGESCAALNTALHTCLADIYLHIQLACAQFQLGRREDAQRELGTARRLAAPDGLTLPFTEHAALLGPLLRSPETAAARSRVSSLSPRELEIAQLAAARRTNAEIAEALHLSEATVKNHLKRIFDKLGLDGGARGKRMLLADVLPKISPLRGL